MTDEPRRIDVTAKKPAGLAGLFRETLRSKPALAMGAGILCGIFAFTLLFAPIFPAGEAATTTVELSMPEGSPAAQASAGPMTPSRTSLMGALFPQAVPSWLGGKAASPATAARKSVASVLLAKAQTALGVGAKPGKPEALRAAGDQAFQKSGKLARVGAPSGGGGGSSASMGSGALAAQASGALGSGSAAPLPVSARKAGVRDSTMMVETGARSPAVSGRASQSSSPAGPAGPGGSKQTALTDGGTEAAYGTASLAAVPHAVARTGGESTSGPTTPALTEKEAGQTDGHLVDKKLLVANAPGVTSISAFDIRYLASLFANLSPETQRKLEAACDRRVSLNMGCNAIDVCLEAEVYTECVQACQAAPECVGLAMFPPTPTITGTPTEVRVGQTRLISVTRAAANARLQQFCTVDNVEKCGGSSHMTDAQGKYTNTAIVEPSHLVGSRVWCAYVIVSGKRSNEACIKVLPALP